MVASRRCGSLLKLLKGRLQEQYLWCFICVCEVHNAVDALFNQPLWTGQHWNLEDTSPGTEVFFICR